MSNKGFSLIELIVVIGIVAILAAVAAPRLQFYFIRARIAKLEAIGNDYINRAKIFYAQHGTFPGAPDLLPVRNVYSGCGNGACGGMYWTGGGDLSWIEVTGHGTKGIGIDLYIANPLKSQLIALGSGTSGPALAFFLYYKGTDTSTLYSGCGTWQAAVHCGSPGVYANDLCLELLPPGCTLTDGRAGT